VSQTQPDGPIPLELRQQVFRELVEAQDGGKTVAASRAEAASRFSISEEQIKDIEREGLANQWPPL
jgi:hypothetical protein